MLMESQCLTKAATGNLRAMAMRLTLPGIPGSTAAEPSDWGDGAGVELLSTSTTGEDRGLKMRPRASAPATTPVPNKKAIAQGTHLRRRFLGTPEETLEGTPDSDSDGVLRATTPADTLSECLSWFRLRKGRRVSSFWTESILNASARSPL